MTPPGIEPCTSHMQIRDSRSVPRTPSGTCRTHARWRQPALYIRFVQPFQQPPGVSVRSLNNAWSLGRQRSASSSVFTAAIILPASCTPPSTRRSRVLRDSKTISIIPERSPLKQVKMRAMLSSCVRCDSTSRNKQLTN